MVIQMILVGAEYTSLSFESWVPICATFTIAPLLRFALSCMGATHHFMTSRRLM
jgi:hypothetical protein